MEMMGLNLPVPVARAGLGVCRGLDGRLLGFICPSLQKDARCVTYPFQGIITAGANSEEKTPFMKGNGKIAGVGTDIGTAVSEFSPYGID